VLFCAVYVVGDIASCKAHAIIRPHINPFVFDSPHPQSTHSQPFVVSIKLLRNREISSYPMRSLMRIVLILCSIVLLGATQVASAQSVTQLEKMCNSGNAAACLDLGVKYAEGEGVRQDKFKAVELYQKACDGGNAWVA
jgi:hypothetical protein